MSRQFFSQAAVVALLAASSLLSAHTANASSNAPSAFRAPADGVRFQVVSVADLNLATEAGNRALYRRLRAAAVKVCAQPFNALHPAHDSDSRCVRDALARAVTTVGLPKLVGI